MQQINTVLLSFVASSGCPSNDALLTSPGSCSVACFAGPTVFCMSTLNSAHSPPSTTKQQKCHYNNLVDNPLNNGVFDLLYTFSKVMKPIPQSFFIHTPTPSSQTPQFSLTSTLDTYVHTVELTFLTCWPKIMCSWPRIVFHSLSVSLIKRNQKGWVFCIESSLWERFVKKEKTKKERKKERKKDRKEERKKEEKEERNKEGKKEGKKEEEQRKKELKKRRRMGIF